MKKWALLVVVLFMSNGVYANEVFCKKFDYACFINDARNKIFYGQRKEGTDILSSMTGLSIESRQLLAITLLSKKEGDDVKKIKTAQLLLESAFREGDMKAGGLLLRFYYGSQVDRDIFPENDEKAIYILKKILQQKKNSSGELDTLLGELLVKNSKEDEAIYWLEKATNRGYPFASANLASIYSVGKHKDLIKAWFYSDLNGTSMASEKSELEKQMTPEQLEQAQQMSWDWQDAHHIRMPGYRSQGSPIQWQVN